MIPLFLIVGFGYSQPRIYTNRPYGYSGIFPSMIQNIYPYYNISTNFTIYNPTTLPLSNETYVDENVKLVVLEQYSTQNFGNMNATAKNALKNAVEYDCISLVSFTGAADISIFKSLWLGATTNTTDLTVSVDNNVTINTTQYIIYDLLSLFGNNPSIVTNVSFTIPVQINISTINTSVFSNVTNILYPQNSIGETLDRSNIIIAQAGCGKVAEIYALPYLLDTTAKSPYEYTEPFIVPIMKWLVSDDMPRFVFSDKHYFAVRSDDFGYTTSEAQYQSFDTVLNATNIPICIGLNPADAGNISIKPYVNNVLSKDGEIFQHGIISGHTNINTFKDAVALAGNVSVSKTWIEGNYTETIYSFLPPYSQYNSSTVIGVTNGGIPIFLDGQTLNYDSLGYNETYAKSYYTTSSHGIENLDGLVKFKMSFVQTHMTSYSPIVVSNHVNINTMPYLEEVINFTKNFTDVEYTTMNDLAVGRGFRVSRLTGTNSTGISNEKRYIINDANTTHVNFISKTNGTYMINFSQNISSVKINDFDWYAYNKSYVLLPMLYNNTNYVIDVTFGNNGQRFYTTSGLVLGLGSTLTHVDIPDMAILLPDWIPYYTFYNDTKIIKYLFKDHFTENNVTVVPTYNLNVTFTKSGNKFYQFTVNNVVDGNPININFEGSPTDLWDNDKKNLTSNENSFYVNLTSSQNFTIAEIGHFNLTEGGNAKLYDASNNLIDANVPIWISSNDRSEVHINSNVSQDMNVTIKFEVDSCDLISNIVYVSDTGKYSKFYADGDYTCEDNYVTIDINGIEPATGSNIIYINSQWLISYRYRPGGIINRNSHNSFNLAALLPYIAGAALLISIVLAAVII